MSLPRWVHVMRAASAVGLVAFAAVIVAAPRNSGLRAFSSDWLSIGVLVLACIVVGSRARLVPRERVAWVAFTVALLSWTSGEIWYAIFRPGSYPSIADLRLGFYPFVYAGIVLLLRSRARAIGGTLWLDGVTASLAAAALGAAVLVEVVVETTSGSLATVATSVAYPIGDLLLLSPVFGVFSLAGWRPGRIWLVLGLGVLSTALADGVYLFQTASGTYVDGAWVDILWPTSMLLIAAAAWAADRSGAELDVEGKPLLAVPATCALGAIGVLVYNNFNPVNLLAIGLATATLLAVVLRLVMTFRENRRLFELTRYEAITDALTGLGNRRKLIADLERRLGGENPQPLLLMIFDLDGFKSYNDTFGHPAGDALLARLGAKLATVPGPEGAAYRLGGDEFCLIVPVKEAEAEPVIDRACSALSERGEGFDVGSSFGAVILPYDGTDPREALHAADERLYAQKYSRRGESDATMYALLEAIALREPDLSMHVGGVGSLAVETGRMLGLRRDELDELARAAQLHDVGKLAVPDEILYKPGALDEREWAFVRQHTLVGERILRASPGLRNVASIVRSTHERWDGRGYPDGLAGEDIALAARIIAVCDAYDAMTSTRPYRGARTPQEALAELVRFVGTQFDPTVVRVLAAHVLDLLKVEHAANGLGLVAAGILPARPRSSVDRAADFESAGGGSTPPGAIA